MSESQPTVTLREYVDQRFDSSEKAIQAALAAAKEAVLKAENASEKRFEAVNEFRATLADQQRMLMPRVESEFRNEGLSKRIEDLEKARIANASGQLGAKNLWGVIIGVLGVASLIVSWLMRF